MPVWQQIAGISAVIWLVCLIVHVYKKAKLVVAEKHYVRAGPIYFVSVDDDMVREGLR